MGSRPEAQARYRLGVDVGGTNTDSVIIDVTRTTDPSTRGVLASYKTETTSDVTSGIETGIRKVLEVAGVDGAGHQLLSLTIGTTHFINAVVQSDVTRLSSVAVIRLAAPYTTEVPPFIDFPENLKRIMNGHTAVIKGGLQIDGRVISELDEEELVDQATLVRAKGLKNIVLVGVYSCLDAEGKQEYKARDILRRELGKGFNIICSRDVGQIGFLERENASILNASIMTFARRTIRGFQLAMQRLKLTCPLYLTQNDGTLITATEAARLPVRTFSSGATNSMRGASYLSGIDLKKKEGAGKSMIVVDIGGTTTDIGVVLPSGFPRQAAAFIEVAGVRTNFSMPDVLSIGLGGGSRVRLDEKGHVTIGPDSVGHHLTRDSKVFGGDVLTTTDITVRAGAANIGDGETVSDINEEVVQKSQSTIKRLLENAIDRMKTSPDDCEVLLVGGGSIIAPTKLKGVQNVIIPPFSEVANAVGAAIASVAGEVDVIEILEGKSLAETLERLKAQAIFNAVKAGADPSTTRLVEVNVLPIQYVTNQATRIIVRAIGELGSSQDAASVEDVPLDVEDIFATEEEPSKGPLHLPPKQTLESTNYSTYKPTIVGNEWILTETDLLFIMEGCGVLGTGGGGSPYSIFLTCRQLLRDGGRIRIVDHTALPDNAVTVRGVFMGSPSVMSERLRGTSHLQLASSELAKYFGISGFAATLCDEIGGGNGMQSLAMSHYYNIPALDGDLMGRAYPKLNQILPAVYDRPNALVPCSLHDGDDNVVILAKAKNEHCVEAIMRVVATEMGSAAALCLPPFQLRDARDFGVTRSHSLAWRIGRAIAICRQTSNVNGVAKAILKLQNGVRLFVGKIVDVVREVRVGFTWGQVRIAQLLDDEMEDHQISGELATNAQAFASGTTMVIPFQNENLCAYLEDESGSRRVAASVPDLITILDSQSGSHLGTSEYTYGLRVTVIALACHPLWLSEAGLNAAGPSAFGLDHEFQSIGKYREPISVIEEYSI